LEAIDERARLGIPRLDGNAGAYLDSGPGRERNALQSKQIVAQVFTRMRHYRWPGILFKQFYSQHVSMVAAERC
jgi:hypothetical protein